MKTITLLIPCFNEEQALPLLNERLQELLAGNPGYEWEVMLIDDGSHDHTLDILRGFSAADDRYKYISLSRNFGKENALLAGFDYASGDCVVIMDADLQHPPQLIPEMIRHWEDGFEDVYARRKDRKTDGWFRRNLSSLYYRLLQKAAHADILQNVGDFRLLDRKCIDALKRLRETERYTKGMYCWIGFRKKEIEFDVAPRAAGKSSFSVGKLLRLAIQGITSYSTAPLKFATWLGFVVSGFAFILFAVHLIKALIFGDPVAGFPTLITVILFIGGIQLLCLGIMGEYLGRIFMETKQRPVYLISETNIPKKTAIRSRQTTPILEKD